MTRSALGVMRVDEIEPLLCEFCLAREETRVAHVGIRFVAPILTVAKTIIHHGIFNYNSRRPTSEGRIHKEERHEENNHRTHLPVRIADRNTPGL